MTAPAAGIERLIHFVDARIRQLRLTKTEVARRGGPSPDSLAKLRGRSGAKTPNVETLLRLDEALGWHPGSAAVTMVGGSPVSLNAQRRAPGRPRQQTPVRPVDAAEIQRRLRAQLEDEIGRLERTRDSLNERIAALRTVAGHFAAEAVGARQIAVYERPEKTSADRAVAGRRSSSSG